ncbi:MAG TPA: carboxypeptidase-like regulatory domain-containing protein, partial [Candidatus Acidoferrales bacterium]|nr:carboxypeptidase-like regulatory domain-containing protein [Candidatus Acidoferrales bacterium]
QSWCLTDSHGNYVLDAVGGTNQWTVAISTPSLTNNYIFSPGYVTTNINAGQAIQVNFSLLTPAPYTISGSVEDFDGNPICGVTVFATATNVDGLPYQAFNATTDANGDYSLNVSPGNWTVGLNQSSLLSLGYDNFPANQNVTISTAPVTGINFQIEVCGEVAILTTNLPNATVGIPYTTALQASSCQTITNWSIGDGITLTSISDQTNITYPAGTPVYSSTALYGYLLTYFGYGLSSSTGAYLTNCSANQLDRGNTIQFSDITALVNVSGPIPNNTVVYINGESFVTTNTAVLQSDGEYQVGLFRSSKDTAGENQYFIYANGDIITTLPSAPVVTNVVATLAGKFLSLTNGNSENVASTIPYPGTNGAAVWLKTGTNNWGEYFISADGQQGGSLPPGLTLSTDGTISGTPTSAGTNGIFNFDVIAEDNFSNAAVQPLSITVTGTGVTTLGSASLMTSSNTFQMLINGVQTGYNYTVQMSTNLASTNWTSIYTTNAPGTNALLVPDSNATNQSRFYRVQVVP